MASTFTSKLNMYTSRKLIFFLFRGIYIQCAWWYMPAIPAIQRFRQEDHVLEVRYMENLSQIIFRKEIYLKCVL